MKLENTLLDLTKHIFIIHQEPFYFFDSCKIRCWFGVNINVFVKNFPVEIVIEY